MAARDDEKRASADRRGNDRRKAADPAYGGPDRRQGDRRTSPRS